MSKPEAEEREPELEQEKEIEQEDRLAPLDRSTTPLPHRCSTLKRLRECLANLHPLIRAHPLVVITPVIVLAILTAVGVVGVTILAGAVKQQREADAMNEAVARGIVIAEKMQMASIPVHGLANFVLGTPNYWWPTIQQGFEATSDALIGLLSGSGVETWMRLQIAPASIMMASWPPMASSAPPSAVRMYLDLLADPTQRENALIAIRTRQLFLAGPYTMKSGNLAAAFRLPVFVNGSYGPDATFGVPLNTVAPFGNTPYQCPECYGALRFWGFCISTLNWDVVRASSKVDDLYNVSGYSFRLTRPAQGMETVDFILAESPDMLNQSFDGFGSDVVQVQLEVLSSEWTLTLSQEGGWEPSWRTPMLVVVVIISVVVALLIGLVMGWNCRLMETTLRLEATGGELQEEKERMDALMLRQHDLIQCLSGAPESSDSEILGLKIDQLRNSLHGHRVSSTIRPMAGDEIELLKLLGSGNFGRVYRGTWRGTTVAVKCIVLPSSMSRSAHAERMALMEAAISSSMHHPHLVQTYTYSIKPIKDSSLLTDNSDLVFMGPMDSWQGSVAVGGASPAAPNSSGTESLCWSGAPEAAVHSFEIQLVLEYCDAGSLDDVLRCGGFHSEHGLNFGGILNTAADVAKGMLHLHMNEILHSDLKSGNVMFKTGGDDGRGVTAKVVDFGLSIQLDVSGNQTHVSKMFQGTPTHMAPEVLLEGKQSKAADVYAFGILLFELYTGSKPYTGIASALLGHHVAREGRRPQFTSFTPKAYRDLAERCWQANPDLRPSFDQVLEELLDMRAAYPASRPLSLPTRDPQLDPPFAAGRLNGPAPSCGPSASGPGPCSAARDSPLGPHESYPSHASLGRGETVKGDPSTRQYHSREEYDDLESAIILTDLKHRSSVRVSLAPSLLVPIPECVEPRQDAE